MLQLCIFGAVGWEIDARVCLFLLIVICTEDNGDKQHFLIGNEVATTDS